METLEHLERAMGEDQVSCARGSSPRCVCVIAGEFEGAARAAKRVTELAELVPCVDCVFARIHGARAVQYGRYEQAQIHTKLACALHDRRANPARSVSHGKTGSSTASGRSAVQGDTSRSMKTSRDARQDDGGI